MPNVENLIIQLQAETDQAQAGLQAVQETLTRLTSAVEQLAQAGPQAATALTAIPKLAEPLQALTAALQKTEQSLSRLRPHASTLRSVADEESRAAREGSGLSHALEGVAMAIEGLRRAGEGVHGIFERITEPIRGMTEGLGEFMREGLAIAAGVEVFSLVERGVERAREAVFGLNGQLEQLQLAFTTVTGSAQTAQALLHSLEEFAAKTPFRFPDLAQAAQILLAVGVNANQVLPVLRAVGSATAALGGDAEKFAIINDNLARMAAMGRVSAREMEDLSRVGVPAWRILAEATHQSVEQLRQDVEKGKISASQFITAFEQFTQVHYGDMLEKQSHTFRGALTTIQDSVEMALARGFRPLFDAISSLADRIATFVQSRQFEEWSNRIQQFVTLAMAKLRELGNFLGQFWSAFKTDGLAGVLNQALRVLGDFGNSLFAAGEKLVSELARGIVAGAVAVYNAVVAIVNKIAALLIGHSPPPEGPLHDITVGGQRVMEAFAEGIKNGQIASTEAALEAARQVVQTIHTTIDQGIQELSGIPVSIRVDASDLEGLKAAQEQVTAAIQEAQDEVKVLEDAAAAVKAQYDAQIQPLQDQLDALKQQIETQQQQLDLTTRRTQAELDLAQLEAEGDPQKRAQLAAQLKLNELQQQQVDLQLRQQELQQKLAQMGGPQVAIEQQKLQLQIQQNAARQQEIQQRLADPHAKLTDAQRQQLQLQLQQLQLEQQQLQLKAQAAATSGTTDLEKQKIELQLQQIQLQQQQLGLIDQQKLAEVTGQQELAKLTEQRQRDQLTLAEIAAKQQEDQLQQQIDALKREEQAKLKPIQDAIELRKQELAVLEQTKQRLQDLIQLAETLKQAQKQEKGAGVGAAEGTGGLQIPTEPPKMPDVGKGVEQGIDNALKNLDLEKKITDWMNGQKGRLIAAVKQHLAEIFLGGIGGLAGAALGGPLGAVIGTAIGVAFGQNLPKVEQWFRQLFAPLEPALSSVQGVIQRVQPAFSGLWETLKRIADLVVSEVKPVWDDLLRVWDAFKEPLKLIAELLGAVGLALLNIVAMGLAAVIPLLAHFGRLLLGIVETGGGVLDLILAIGKALIGDWGGAIDSALTGIRHLGQGWDEMRKNMTALFDPTQWGALAKQWGDVVRPGIEGLGQTITGTTTTGSQQFGALATAGTTHLTTLSTMAREHGGYVQAALDTHVTQSAGQAGTALSTMAQQGGTALSSVSTAAQTHGADTAKAITTTMKPAIDDASTALQGLEKTGTTSFTNLATTASQKTTEVTQATGGIKPTVTNQFADSDNWLVAAGKAIIAGLIRGLWDATTDALKSTLNDVKDYIIQHKGPIEDDLRLLQPAGQALMAGLGQGIRAGLETSVAGALQETTQRVTATVQDLADSAHVATALAGQATQPATQASGQATERLRDLLRSITEALASWFDQFREALAGLQASLRGLADAARAAQDALLALAGGAPGAPAPAAALAGTPLIQHVGTTSGGTPETAVQATVKVYIGETELRQIVREEVEVAVRTLIRTQV